MFLVNFVTFIFLPAKAAYATNRLGLNDGVLHYDHVMQFLAIIRRQTYVHKYFCSLATH